jgi:hypothetical protein
MNKNMLWKFFGKLLASVGSFLVKMSLFICKVFTRFNFVKVLILFIVGLTSRISINYIYDTNIFADYFSEVSFLYYFFFSVFLVVVHEIFHYNDITINVNPTSTIPKYNTPIVSHMKPYDQNFPNASGNGYGNNTTSSSAATSGNPVVRSPQNSFVSNEPIDKFLSEDDVNRLKESKKEASKRRRCSGIRRGIAVEEAGENARVLARGEITRIRREEKLASDQR